MSNVKGSNKTTRKIKWKWVTVVFIMGGFAVLNVLENGKFNVSSTKMQQQQQQQQQKEQQQKLIMDDTLQTIKNQRKNVPIDLLMNEKCYWERTTQTKNPIDMCLRGTNDLLSNAVRRDGCWKDCTILSYMFTAMTKEMEEEEEETKSLSSSSSSSSSTSSAAASSDSYYYDYYFLDIGGNIGSCSLDMASQRKELNIHQIVAFEPVPHNLFYFQQSLIKNHWDDDQVVKVIDCGVGTYDQHGTITTIYSETTNFGNSIISKDSTTFRNDPNFNAIDICIISIDKILIHHPILLPSLSSSSSSQQQKQQQQSRTNDIILKESIIPVMKMDIQGFEYYALLGAKELFQSRKVKSIKTEFAPWWIRKTGVSDPIILLELLDSYGYDIYLSFLQQEEDTSSSGGGSSGSGGVFQQLLPTYQFRQFVDKFGSGQNFVDIYAKLR